MTGDESPATMLVPGSLELNRKLPLWYQVAQHLRTAIYSRREGDPDRLPTEENLAAHYGVSVVTMRQALKSLEDEGLVRRLRRRGTFINPLPAAPPLTLLGSVDAVVAQQASAEVEVLERRNVEAPPDLAGYFGERAALTRFRRLRKQKGEPVSCADNWLPVELAERISDNALTMMPMTQALRERAHARIELVENRVEAGLATPELVELLDVSLLSPILRCTGITHTTDGRVIDYARIHYRGDRFTYAVALRAD